jgi:hypothetical protein
MFVLLLFVAASVSIPIDCSSCKIVIANPTQDVVTVNTAGVLPGDKICFDTAVLYTKVSFIGMIFFFFLSSFFLFCFVFQGFVFSNVVGAPGNPVVITQCGAGVARLTMSAKQHAMIISGSSNVKVSGYTGVPDVYGLQLSRCSFGIKLDKGTTDIELEYVEIFDNFGHACVSSKSDPSDLANNLPNVTFPQVCVLFFGVRLSLFSSVVSSNLRDEKLELPSYVLA